jgi:hypothetical protein
MPARTLMIAVGVVLVALSAWQLVRSFMLL